MNSDETTVAQDKSEIVREIPRACADEAEAVAFIERLRWGNDPYCPRCGCTGEDVYQMKAKDGTRNKRFLWKCRGCKRQFTVRIGTIFEESLIPMRHWCYAFWAACASKKGVSALQIKRMTGLTYKSALFMMHRIRFAMADQHEGIKLTGTIEADETYIGGKPRYRRKKGEEFGRIGRGTDKPIVFAMVERGGGVRAMVVPSVTSETLGPALKAHCDTRKSRLITDEYIPYKRPGRHFEKGHETVAHGEREYVRGDVTTNTVEGFFSLLKRGIYGTFHNVSPKHLHRYVAEFEFRYCNRNVDDGERTMRAIKGAEGKRLMYREPIDWPDAN